MSSLEFNKVFAAVLVAGITAMLSGFVAHKVVHAHELEEDAVPIEGSVVLVASGPKKVALPDPVLELIATADVVRGQKLSKACAACHSFDKGGPDRVGPNLWNALGRPKAGKGSFSYSKAMSEFGGAWGYFDLNKFIWKPKKYIVGTKMGYAGLKKPADRAAIIAWLRTKSDNPMPLPNAAEIAAEKAELLPSEADAAGAPESH